jgi:hypothetical protein
MTMRSVTRQAVDHKTEHDGRKSSFDKLESYLMSLVR